MQALQPNGPSWDERAKKDHLAAVLDPDGSKKKNLYIHAAQTIALKRVLRNIYGKFALDFGCGTGRMTKLLGSQGWHVIGVDITYSMLLKAKKVINPKGSFVLTDGLMLPFGVNRFDLIVSVYALQHVIPDSRLFNMVANELFRVIKPGGQLVMIEITDRQSYSVDNYKVPLTGVGFTCIHDEPVRQRFDRYMALAERRFVSKNLIPLLGWLGIWECRRRYRRAIMYPDWWDHLYIFRKQS